MVLIYIIMLIAEPLIMQLCKQKVTDSKLNSINISIILQAKQFIEVYQRHYKTMNFKIINKYIKDIWNHFKKALDS